MSAAKSKARSSAYKHAQESVQRPDIGVEAQFSAKKAPKTYRYDSSLAPELCWDENGERPFADWLLNLVTEAAEKGEGVVFAEPQVWAGTQEKFTSLSQCAMVGIRMTPDREREVKVEAAQRGISVADLFDEIWTDYVDRRPKQ